MAHPWPPQPPSTAPQFPPGYTSPRPPPRPPRLPRPLPLHPLGPPLRLTRHHLPIRNLKPTQIPEILTHLPVPKVAQHLRPAPEPELDAPVYTVLFLVVAEDFPGVATAEFAVEGLV